MRACRVLFLGRREALGVLRQGTPEAVKEYGLKVTGRALAVVGHWDELRSLATSKESIDTLAMSLLDDPGLSVERVLELAASCSAGTLPGLMDKAALHVAPDVLLAFARDHKVPYGEVLAHKAAAVFVEQGEWQEALLALGPHGESVDIKTAGKWVFMCGGGKLQRDLISLLGERDGHLAGAACAAKEDPREGMPQHGKAIGQCLLTMELCLESTQELASRALLLVRWAEELDIPIEARFVGRVCIRLAREKDLEGVHALLAAVPSPDGVCCDALVNVLAEFGQVEKALEGARRMKERGAQVSNRTFQRLLDTLEDNPQQLRVFEVAHSLLRGNMDRIIANRWIKALLRFGKWEEALELFGSGQPDLITYVTMVSGLSELDHPKDALSVAQQMMDDSRCIANEVAFTALRSLCRTHGLERRWPAMRQWCVSHGVRVGPINNSWRESDKVSNDAGRLLFPK